MTLSERERRLLQEMETHLLAEDPGLASSLGVSRLQGGMSVLLAASGLVIGILLMAVGVGRGHLVGTLVALVGYLFLLAGSVIGGESLRSRGGQETPAPSPIRRAPGTS